MIIHEEKEILDTTVELWNKIIELDLRENEGYEFMQYIHSIQNAIAARSTFREINDES